MAIENLITATPEAWEPVAGYEGIYSVSDQGRVRSEDRHVNGNPNGGLRLLRGQVMKPQAWGSGYLTVRLAREGKARTCYVHHIVVAAFGGPPPGPLGTRGDYQINHRDGDKQNNCASNLEYVLQGDNVRHAFRTGLQPLGRSRAHTRLTDDDVRAVRKAVAAGDRLKEVGRRFGVTPEHVSLIARGKRRSNIQTTPEEAASIAAALGFSTPVDTLSDRGGLEPQRKTPPT